MLPILFSFQFFPNFAKAIVKHQGCEMFHLLSCSHETVVCSGTADLEEDARVNDIGGAVSEDSLLSSQQ